MVFNNIRASTLNGIGTKTVTDVTDITPPVTLLRFVTFYSAPRTRASKKSDRPNSSRKLLKP